MEFPTIYLQAAFLGVLEGVTEFLPVSSTGHLILAIDVLGFAAPPGKVFEVAVQVGAILAIMTVYFEKMWGLLTRWPHDKFARQQIITIALGFAPALGLGALLHDYIKQVLFSPAVVASALIVGGIAMLIIEKFKPNARVSTTETITRRQGLIIGLGQCLALVPGVSRSGATIVTALLCGIERKVATEFSFLLSVPTLLAATVYDLYKNHTLLVSHDAAVIGVGLMFAFFSALFVVKNLIAFVGRHGFAPFAWYRIVLGTVFLWLL